MNALGVLILFSSVAHAYVPPSGFLFSSIAKKRAVVAGAPKSIKIRTQVTLMDGETQLETQFKQVMLYDLVTRQIRSFAFDDQGRALFTVDRKLDGDPGVPESMPLATRLMVDGNAQTLMAGLKIYGIPARAEADLAKLEKEEDKRAQELTFLARYKGGLSWGVGPYSPSNVQAEPQVWIEKDTFLPQRLVQKFSDGLREIRFDGYRFFKEFPVPKATYLIKPEGGILSESLKGALLKEELIEVILSADVSEFKMPLPQIGMTETGKSSDSALQDLLKKYYTAIK